MNESLTGGRLFGERLLPQVLQPNQPTDGAGGQKAIRFRKDPELDYGGPVVEADDRVRFFGWAKESNLQHLDCWLKILSVDSVTSEYDECTALVLRGPAGYVIPAGTPWVSYGKPDQGLIFLTADGIEADKSDAPYIDFLLSGPDLTPWDVDTVMRLGRLRGVLGLDPTQDHIGLAVGQGGIWDAEKPHVVLTNQVMRLRGIEVIFLSSLGIEIGGIDPHAGPDSPGFYLGPKNAPAVWALGDGTVGIDNQLIVGEKTELIFTRYAGSVLLGPYTRQDGSSWYSSRGHEATIAGSVQTRIGRYAGTRALEFLPTATNLCTDPLFKASTWWDASNYCSKALVTDYPYAGTKCLKITRTSTAGTPYVRHEIKANPPLGYTVSASIWVRTKDPNAQNKPIYLLLRELTSNQEYAQSGDTVYLSSSWQRLAVARRTTGTTRTSFQILVTAGSLPNNAYFYMDGLTITNLDSPGSDVWGDRAGCDWDGGEPTTSSCTLSRLSLGDMVEDVNGQGGIGFHIWAQMLRDWDEGGGPLTLLDLVGSDPLSNRYLAQYYPGGRVLVTYNGQTLIDYTMGEMLRWHGGDYVHLYFDHSWLENTHRLYVNRVEVASRTVQATRFYNMINWYMGATYNNADASGWALFELALFQRSVPAPVIGELYYLGHPLIDTGASEVPGIYIFDGQFMLASSLSGQRIIMDSAGISLYDDAGDLGMELVYNGLYLHTGPDQYFDELRSISFYSESQSAVKGYIKPWESSGFHGIYAAWQAVTGKDTGVSFNVTAPSSQSCGLDFSAYGDGGDNVTLGVYADDSKAYAALYGGGLALNELSATPGTVSNYAVLFVDTSGGLQRLRIRFETGNTYTLQADS